MSKYPCYPVIFLVLLLGNSPYLPAQEQSDKKIILVEKAKQVTDLEAAQAAEMDSEKNPDGGYNANPTVVDCFAAMKYHYTGGRYVDEPIYFRMRFPEKIEPGKKYPLILSLHGVGESGNDNQRQLSHLHYALKSFVGKNTLDFFMIVPQCPEDNKTWETSISNEGKGDAPLTIANEILGHVIEEYPIDLNRIGVIGICSGGNAAWEYVANNPGRFSALAAFSSTPGRVNPNAFLNTAVWAFNNKDDVVPYQVTEKFVNDINALNGNAYVTLWDHGGHITWPSPLSRKNLVNWVVLQNLDGTGILQEKVYYHRSVVQLFFMFGLPVVIIVVSLMVLTFQKRKTIRPENL